MLSLIEQRLGVHGHFNLARHRLAQLAAIGNQHRERHSVELRQGGQRVDGHTYGGVLHDDAGAFATHEGAGAEAHAFVFLVGRDVKNLGPGFDLVNHTGQLLAGHGGDESHVIGHEIVNDFAVDGHVGLL